MRTESYSLCQDLMFRDRSDRPIPVYGETLTLVWFDNTEATAETNSEQDSEGRSEGFIEPSSVFECRLSLQSSFERYQRIDCEALFNLDPELRRSFSNGNFLPEYPLYLEITLKPDLLPQILPPGEHAETIALHLINLNSQLPEAEVIPTTTTVESLFNTENWVCLNVKQIQDSGETGYSTFWQYVNPASLKQPEAFQEQIASGFLNFMKDEVQANLPAAAQDTMADLLQGFTNLFGELRNWLIENLLEGSQVGATHSLALDTVIQFFAAEEWPYIQLQEEATLRLSFRGNHGQWTCYARVRDEQKQFVFYSLCPVEAAEHQRLAIAELITRINYGIVSGNFEMDFNDGEIRYKTNIDVGDELLLPW